MTDDPIEKAARDIVAQANISPKEVAAYIREAVKAETKDLREKLKVAREEYADLEALYGYELEKANDER